MRGFLRWVLTSAVVMAASGGARAEVLGAPTSGEIGFQPINSDNAADIVWFHNVFLLPGDDWHFRAGFRPARLCRDQFQ